MDWFLYDNGLRHEKVNSKNARSINLPSSNPFIRKFHKELLAKDNIGLIFFDFV